MKNNKLDQVGKSLKKFIDSGVTPYHVVEYAKSQLDKAGFINLHEDASFWQFIRGRGYYVIRNGSSLIAWIHNSNGQITSPVRLILAHTDSPCIKIKPNAPFNKKSYFQLAVEPYGGLLQNSWLNRDLGIAGRFVYANDSGEIYSKLVDLDTVCTIPQLAIHLDPKQDEQLSLNKQNHLAPILGLSNEHVSDIWDRLLYDNVDANTNILSYDLSFYDKLRLTVGGIDNSFIYSARLDNLLSCHAALKALIDTYHANKFDNCKLSSVPLVALFNHEEVGNQSTQGADSSFLSSVLMRLAEEGDFTNRRSFLSQIMSKSFCISADVAHAVHPNYSDKHEPHHQPVMGGGPVIKSNSNQRYATTDISSAIFMSLCKMAGVPYQQFVARSDMKCGSTVGPVTSAILGVPTVDIGSPILSMHSIREMGCLTDHTYLIKVFQKYFSMGTLGLAS